MSDKCDMVSSDYWDMVVSDKWDVVIMKVNSKFNKKAFHWNSICQPYGGGGVPGVCPCTSWGRSWGWEGREVPVQWGPNWTCLGKGGGTCVVKSNASWVMVTRHPICTQTDRHDWKHSHNVVCGRYILGTESLTRWAGCESACEREFARVMV